MYSSVPSVGDLLRIETLKKINRLDFPTVPWSTSRHLYLGILFSGFDKPGLVDISIRGWNQSIQQKTRIGNYKYLGYFRVMKIFFSH